MPITSRYSGLTGPTIRLSFRQCKAPASGDVAYRRKHLSGECLTGYSTVSADLPWSQYRFQLFAYERL